VTGALAVAAIVALGSGQDRLSVADRCAMVHAILNAKAKQQIPGDQHLKTVDRAFFEIDDVERRTRRADRIVVRVELYREKKGVALFGPADSCGGEAFILVHEEPEPAEAKPNPQGNSDMVVKIELRPDGRGSRTMRFKFEEKLGLSGHSYGPASWGGEGGGYAVPPVRYVGSVEQGDDGAWRATVTRAIFAS